MSLLSLKKIQERLQDRRLAVVSKATGVSVPVLTKMRDGEPHNYTLNTVRKVSSYLRRGDPQKSKEKAISK